MTRISDSIAKLRSDIKIFLDHFKLYLSKHFLAINKKKIMKIENFFSALPCYEDPKNFIKIQRISLKLELWFKSYRVQTDTQTNFLQNVPGIVNFTLFGQQNTPVLACLYIMGVNLSTRILLSSLCISAKSHISQEEK